jgi:hypothetical protein
MVLACALVLIWLPIAIVLGSDRGPRMMLVIDRLANALFGGSSRETISSRAYRGMNEGDKGWCFLCKALDIIEQDHCEKSAGK